MCNLKRQKLIGVVCVLLLFIVCYHPVLAQIKLLEIAPAITDPSVEQIHSPHMASYSQGGFNRHRLIVMIPGTGAKATSSRKQDSIFASMGFHVISLDYNNNVIAVSCSGSDQEDCFDRYRSEIVTGTPASPLVSVDTANSIINRFSVLLRYLVKTDPSGGWQEYINAAGPVWERIIAAGHSQGAGHAAYLGKLFKLDRVIMFSGPQDFSNTFNKPAPWQEQKGKTSPSRFFAFLHMKDPFGMDHQLANCAALMGSAKPDTMMVYPGRAIEGKRHILITDISTTKAHSAVLKPEFREAWEYMLTTQN